MNSLKVKSFSCGRGIHKVFVFDGLLPVAEGYIIKDRYMANPNIEIGQVAGLERVSALWSYLKHRRSEWFYETTNFTSNILDKHYFSAQ